LGLLVDYCLHTCMLCINILPVADAHQDYAVVQCAVITVYFLAAVDLVVFCLFVKIWHVK